jgi:hypothetical protein
MHNTCYTREALAKIFEMAEILDVVTAAQFDVPATPGTQT